MLTQSGVVLHYLRLAVWPFDLCFDYSDWPWAAEPRDFVPQSVVVGLLFLASAYGCLRRSAYGFLGIQTQPRPVVQGPRVSTVETFQLSADHNQLNYSVVITDPDYLTAPLTVAKFWQYVPGAKVQPYSCTP